MQAFFCSKNQKQKLKDKNIGPKNVNVADQVNKTGGLSGEICLKKINLQCFPVKQRTLIPWQSQKTVYYDESFSCYFCFVCRC